jgi:hypothetical protein
MQSSNTVDFDSVNLLFGDLSKVLHSSPTRIFHSKIVDFLTTLSNSILHDLEASQHPDLTYFAFWIRAGNLNSWRDLHGNKFRFGLGPTLHITPANVPTNFLYSMVFGLVSGNSNVIRVPTKDFPQVKIITRILFSMEKPHSEIAYEKIALVRYPKMDRLTSHLLSFCKALIVWGSNQTVKELRLIPKPPDCREVIFNNKNSILIIKASEIQQMNRRSKKELSAQLSKVYSDSFLFDQNGCSSPKVVFWIGDFDQINTARELFWSELAEIVKSKYEVDNGVMIRKFTNLSKLILEKIDLKNISLWGNFIYSIPIETMPSEEEFSLCRFGIFFENRCDSLENFFKVPMEGIQTLSYIGFKKTDLQENLRELENVGIDRIVPAGEAFQMSLIWDGIDCVSTLSKLISLR